jgi:hypothetical protein
VEAEGVEGAEDTEGFEPARVSSLSSVRLCLPGVDPVHDGDRPPQSVLPSRGDPRPCEVPVGVSDLRLCAALAISLRRGGAIA